MLQRVQCDVWIWAFVNILFELSNFWTSSPLPRTCSKAFAVLVTMYLMFVFLLVVLELEIDLARLSFFCCLAFAVVVFCHSCLFHSLCEVVHHQHLNLLLRMIQSLISLHVA